MNGRQVRKTVGAEDKSSCPYINNPITELKFALVSSFEAGDWHEEDEPLHFVRLLTNEEADKVRSSAASLLLTNWVGRCPGSRIAEDAVILVRVDRSTGTGNSRSVTCDGRVRQINCRSGIACRHTDSGREYVRILKAQRGLI